MPCQYFDRNCTTGSAGILPALARHARWHGHAARAVDAGVRHFGNRTLSMIAVQPLAALGAQPGVAVPLAVAQALLPGMFVSVRMGGTLSPRSGRHPVTIVPDSGCACFWVGLRPLIAGRLMLNWASPLREKALPFPGVSTFPVQHHPGAQGATPPHPRRGAFRNSPPDSGGEAPEAPGWLHASAGTPLKM